VLLQDPNRGHHSPPPNIKLVDERICDASEHRTNIRDFVDPDRKGRQSTQPDLCPGTRSERRQYREQGDLVAESRPREPLHAERTVLGKRVPNADALRRDQDHHHMHLSKSARYSYDCPKGDVRPVEVRRDVLVSGKPQRRKEDLFLDHGTGLSHPIPVNGPKTVDRDLLQRVGLRTTHGRTTVASGVTGENASQRYSHLPDTINSGNNALASRSFQTRDSLLGKQRRGNMDTLRKQPKVLLQQKWVAPTARNTAITPNDLSRFATSARSVPDSSALMRRARLGPISGLVPRPSATPDRFSRPAKQHRASQNPLASTK
jgi:hypothetical protein